jgi:DNA polymerase-3 subunit delta'
MAEHTLHPKINDFAIAFSAGTLSHAHLIVGQEGYGGLPLALQIARLLVCTDAENGEACCVCESCKKCDKLIHPDVHFSFPFVSKGQPNTTSKDWIDEWKKLIADNPHSSYNEWLASSSTGNKQGNINVAETNEIIQKLGLKSFQGGSKVMIIWMADYLSKEGNKLLKLIEEPPDNTYFILTAAKEHNVLTTIKSRTQITRLLPYQDGVLRSMLQTNGQESGLIENAVHLAEGDYNRAHYVLNNISDNDQIEAFRLWMQYCAKSKIHLISSWCDEMATNGREGVKVFLETALHLIRESSRNKCIDYYKIRTENKYTTFVQNFSGFATLHSLDRMYEEINKHYYHITRNANPRINLFELSLTLNQILTHQK